MPAKSWYYYTLFGLLYFVQGAALAYINNFQKPYLDSLNIGSGSIGLFTSILKLPFILAGFNVINLLLLFIYFRLWKPAKG